MQGNLNLGILKMGENQKLQNTQTESAEAAQAGMEPEDPEEASWGVSGSAEEDEELELMVRKLGCLMNMKNEEERFKIFKFEEINS